MRTGTDSRTSVMARKTATAAHLCLSVGMFVCLLGPEVTCSAAEIRSYEVNLVHNEKESKAVGGVKGQEENWKEVKSNVVHYPQRSTVNVLEEKQHMLEKDFSKMKEHLTRLEWKMSDFHDQKKQTEIATRDLQWAVGNLKKSILTLEKDMTTFKNQKSGLEKISLQEVRATLNSLQIKMEHLAEDSKRKDENINKIWSLMKAVDRVNTNQLNSLGAPERGRYSFNERVLKNSVITNEIPREPVASSSPSPLARPPKITATRAFFTKTVIMDSREDVSLTGDVAENEVNGSKGQVKNEFDERAHQEIPLLERFDQLQSKIHDLRSSLEEMKKRGVKVNGIKISDASDSELDCYRKSSTRKGISKESTQEGDSKTQYEVDPSPDHTEEEMVDNRSQELHENFSRRLDGLEDKVTILQLNSTVGSSTKLNRDLKLRLELAHVSFQTSELANEMHLLRSAVNRIFKELRTLKGNTNLFHETNRLTMADDQ